MTHVRPFHGALFSSSGSTGVFFLFRSEDAPRVRRLTEGTWPVVDMPIHVDAQRQLVYFIGKRDTVLENHAYVASYAPDCDPQEIVRLTELGFSYAVTMNESRDICVCTFSSLASPPATVAFRLVFQPVRVGSFRCCCFFSLQCVCKGCSIPVCVANPRRCFDAGDFPRCALVAVLYSIRFGLSPVVF